MSTVEQVKAVNIAKNLAFMGDPLLLENEIANRVIYSTSVAVTSADLKFDLSLLVEAIKLDVPKFYEMSAKKIYIPEILLEKFPNATMLAQAFIDACQPKGITALCIKSIGSGTKVVGTVIRPEMSKGGNIYIWVDKKRYRVPVDKLSVFPEKRRADIKFESNCATLDGQKVQVLEITGGEVGLIIDTRTQ